MAAFAYIHFSIVNWGGDEVARVEVLPSDIVLLGQKQIEDQIGVPPHKQRLVHGEQQLDEGELWSAYGLLDWSTVQLTVIDEVSRFWFTFTLCQLNLLSKSHCCQVSANLFSPLAYDSLHKGEGLTIHPINSLCLIGGGLKYYTHVLGTIGMEVNMGSGERGYFEMRIDCPDVLDSVFALSNVIVGLATHNEKHRAKLGFGSCSYGWLPDGFLMTSCRVIGQAYDNYDPRPALRFGNGDVVGIMIDCTELPTIRLFRNGEMVDCQPVIKVLYGQILFPAFNLTNGQIWIVPNPNIPEFEHII